MALDDFENTDFDDKMKEHEKKFPDWAKNNVPDIDLLPERQQKSIFDLYRRSKGFEYVSDDFSNRINIAKKRLDKQEVNQQDLMKILQGK